MPSLLSKLAEEIQALDPRRFEGRVTGLSGALVEVTGPVEALALGTRVTIHGHTSARGEIVGFRGDRALIAPYDSIEAIRPGARVVLEGASPMARPSQAWLGRVIDCSGNPVDGEGPLPNGLKPTPVRAPPPSAHDRARVGGRLDVGVRALNIFAALCRGQRMGVFAGSGVGRRQRCEQPPTATRCASSRVQAWQAYDPRGNIATTLSWESVMTVNGRCLCGAVRWESTEPPVTTRVCWCRDCQFLGAGSGTVGACFRTETFKVTGTTSDYASVADSGNRMHRRFCPNCGTPLFSEAEARPHLIFVRVGSFDDPDLAQPAMTIWTSSAPRWACIDAGLPRVEQHPPPAA